MKNVVVTRTPASTIYAHKVTGEILASADLITHGMWQLNRGGLVKGISTRASREQIETLAEKYLR